MSAKKQTDLIILFIFLMVVGLLFGNIIFIGMSLIPLVFITAGTVLKAPGTVSVATGEVPPKLQLGKEFDIIRTITIEKGYGPVRLFQKLPDEFELIDGSNIRMVWKPKNPVRVMMSCRVRCSKRGNYVIPPLQWSSRHPLYLSANGGSIGATIAVSVWPHLLKHREVSQLKNLALSPFPLADTSRIGVAGTDFREIRDYVNGDPIKTINWKATAHRANPGAIWPLINEYEREGRKSVLIFLDASEVVEIGSTKRNVLEYAIEAASNLLYYYIYKGYRVGVAVNSEHSIHFYPDSGRQQLTRIIPQLVHLKAGGDPVRLLHSIDDFETYILNHKPLSILVSTLDAKSGDVLARFHTKLRSYYSIRRQPPIVLVNVIGRDLIPVTDEYKSHLPELMQLQAVSVIRRLRRTGVTIMEWNPAKQSFHSVLAGRVRGR